MLTKEKRAALAMCAILCAERSKKKKRLRVWTRKWLGKRGQYGLSILQRELEVDDMRGFRDLLRMSVEDFNYLLERVSPAIIKKDTHLRKAISPRERLSTPSTESEWKAIARDFANKWQFPHCLGAIDGKHIFIQPPPKSGSMYFNYKSRFSIILMAVVDANYKFVYASAGTQGRVSDAGVLAHSDLKEAMDTGTLNFPPADTLPGTDAMMPHMLIGDDRIYNYRLSRARRVVENAFGILANRFRVFRTTICLDPDKVVTIIFACLCLHNYLRDHRSDAYVPPGYVDSEDGELQSVSMGLARNPSVEAKKQRDVLCEYFVSPAGSVSWQEDMV
uniref:DDE Tnp4 domain-containing protein n=1 Tax=Oreochromis aureus TaxID=47969 RepID=A0AAZ1XSW5_OREAU